MLCEGHNASFVIREPVLTVPPGVTSLGQAAHVSPIQRCAHAFFHAALPYPRACAHGTNAVALQHTEVQRMYRYCFSEANSLRATSEGHHESLTGAQPRVCSRAHAVQFTLFDASLSRLFCCYLRYQQSVSRYAYHGVTHRVEAGRQGLFARAKSATNIAAFSGTCGLNQRVLVSGNVGNVRRHLGLVSSQGFRILRSVRQATVMVRSMTNVGSEKNQTPSHTHKIIDSPPR